MIFVFIIEIASMLLIGRLNPDNVFIETTVVWICVFVFSSFFSSFVVVCLFFVFAFAFVLFCLIFSITKLCSLKV